MTQTHALNYFAHRLMADHSTGKYTHNVLLATPLSISRWHWWHFQYKLTQAPDSLIPKRYSLADFTGKKTKYDANRMNLQIFLESGLLDVICSAASFFVIINPSRKV
jgi:hypothetical protein